ncbi:putative bifunctional diguanylate cyclase/phosphodiesterase [Noviherbaspirillum suwonense]|uniref:PAS domain S-box-containing protein/diguanylate cyclase (GGDEF) domain-containing protein n=1 Tax=Noviherbaspirillum suwonense TaxID=1224511 RepID=A0ABY1PWD7_9BURK|nr:bifunctional diguanylate cyclase/phosphodiesterase [Noviherbaspirillum suwonense]SMP48522.1 PAS domain S-box-containing protein/diguanylate cyclase (GGDEF) domain-containing protein [Noviherbaspirillum suwonense]
MKLPLVRAGGAYTGPEIFRLASLFLYASLLLEICLLWWMDKPGSTRSVKVSLFVVAALAVVALIRFARPGLHLLGRRHVLLELLAAGAAIGMLSLQSQLPIAPLPWWIGLASVFALELQGSLALAVILAVAVAGALTSVATGGQPEDWLPGFFVTLFAGLLSASLSKAMAANQASLEQALMNERRFNVIARAARHVFMITDRRFRTTYINPAITDVLGYSEQEMLAGAAPAIHPEDLPRRNANLQLLRRKAGASLSMKLRIRHREGHWVWLEIRGYNMLHDPAIGGLVFSIEDISARVEAERKLTEEHALLRTVLDLNPSMIYAKDSNGRFTITNASFQKHYGYASDAELHGKTTEELPGAGGEDGRHPVLPETARRMHLQDMHVIRSGVAVENLEVQDMRDGEVERWYRTFKYPLRDSSGAASGMLAIVRDVTDSKEYEMRLEHLAMHDSLTGLPNRRFMLKMIADLILPEGVPPPQIAVLYFDLDFFKSVNDTHGHDTGDRCLMEVARRIRYELPPEDMVSRFGGDEFVILTHAGMDAARERASRLLSALDRPVVIDDIVVKLHGSIGIAKLLPSHRTPSELIRDADAAMYQAKERGRNRVEAFNAELQVWATRRAQMDVALRFALERKELTLVYQPQVALADGRLCGFELLLRWNSPQYGEIKPDDFIPIAERSGMVVPIGLWALEQACIQLKKWHQAYPRQTPVTLGVNVSMRQLMHSSFIGEVAQILVRTGVAANCIELELTESSAMANPQQTIENLSRLKSLGVRLALDDFGTGYSSLAYLQRLPIDVLKIDRAFARGLGLDNNDAGIVQMILTLAQLLDLDTIAEGVETAEQITVLRRLGCRMGQGYFFSAGVPAAQAERLLAADQPYPLSLTAHA